MILFESFCMSLLLIHVPVGPEKSFPLGLAYLSAAARNSGFHVKGLDLSETGEKELHRRIQDPSVKWVGMSTFTRTWPQVAGLTHSLKALRNDIHILLGGPHATCLPEKVLRESAADTVVVGEGENTLVEILKHPGRDSRGKIPGLSFLEQGDLVTTALPDPIQHLDTLPFPDRTLLPVHRYGTGMLAQLYPYTAMITSRGCNASCHYCPCSSLWRGGWRGRSPENVLEEMYEVHHRFRIHHFIMEDDQFLASGERVEEFCKLLHDRNAPFTWELANGIHPTQISLERIPLMAQGGCRSLTLALETRHLDARVTGREPYHMESVKDLTRHCHNHGIFVGAYFLLGFPGETRGQIEENIRDALTLPLDSAHFSILEPLPGTFFHKDLDEFHRMRPDTEHLESCQKKAYRRFYLRPRLCLKIFRLLLKNPKLLKILFSKAREIFSTAHRGRHSHTRRSKF